MQTPQQKAQQKRIAKMNRELERRSRDQLIVKNPTKEVRFVIWDGYQHSVPTAGQSVFPRYIAQKYIRETIDFLINEDEKYAVEKEAGKRAKRGHPVMTAQEKDQFVIGNGLRTDNPVRRKKYMAEVYGGVSTEYGKDMPEMAAKAPTRERLPMDVELMAEIDGGLPKIEIKEDLEDTTDKKKALEKEIAE